MFWRRGAGLLGCEASLYCEVSLPEKEASFIGNLLHNYHGLYAVRLEQRLEHLTLGLLGFIIA